LTAGCHLHGLFGVDCVLREDVPWPVEVNPRYTASVEVLEYATGVMAVDRHRQVFDAQPPPPPPAAALPSCVGKAILFARAPVRFPEDGPWTPVLRRPGPVEEMPAFADLPHPGERIEAGRPVLTCFAQADSPAGCLEALRQVAADLDRRLIGG